MRVFLSDFSRKKNEKPSYIFFFLKSEIFWNFVRENLLFCPWKKNKNMGVKKNREREKSLKYGREARLLPVKKTQNMAKNSFHAHFFHAQKNTASSSVIIGSEALVLHVL